MIWVGIDNGISGALAAVDDDSRIISMTGMPTGKNSRGARVDSKAVSDWLGGLWQDTGTRPVVLLEIPGKFSKGILAVASMWDCFGAIRSILEVQGFRHRLVQPKEWQSKLLPGCAAGNTKPEALIRAKQLWPEEKWLLSPRCRTPDTGLIDAALIAEFGRLNRI